MEKKFNTFSVPLGLLDYVNPILYTITMVTTIKNLSSEIAVPFNKILLIGAVISIFFGFIIPTGKVIVGLGIIEFVMPVSLVFCVNSGILLSGLVLFCYVMKLRSYIFWVMAILIIVLLAASAFYVYRWVVSNDYLMDRIEQTQEGDSSNRDRIYLNMWNKWYESDNTINYLFGYGYQGTSSLGVSAHSDWLEILVDYGLLGILLYLMIFIALTRQILRTKNLQLKYILISASIIWFFKSVYSMGFVSPYTPILMISLGTALGQNKLERSLS